MLATGLRAVILLFVSVCYGAPVVEQRSVPDSAFSTIYEFPNLTWVENLAVRSNGNILVSLINKPEVWEINITTHTAELIHRFLGTISAMGFAEYEPDVFGIAIGNWSDVTFKADAGSWSIWSIDMRECGFPKRSADSVKIKKVTAIPNADFLNGACVLPTESHTILVGDANRGVVYRVDMDNSEYVTAIDSPAFKPNPAATTVLGINGIHVRDDYLYFTNSFQAPVLGRVPLHLNGTAAGPVQEIVQNATYPVNLGYHADDFTFDEEGNAWIATDVSGSLVKVSPNGDLTFVGGGLTDPAVAGDTSAAFGRTAKDGRTLYITTNGGLVVPPVGGTVGGKLVALDTTGL